MSRPVAAGSPDREAHHTASHNSACNTDRRSGSRAQLAMKSGTFGAATTVPCCSTDRLGAVGGVGGHGAPDALGGLGVVLRDPRMTDSRALSLKESTKPAACISRAASSARCARPQVRGGAMYLQRLAQQAASQSMSSAHFSSGHAVAEPLICGFVAVSLILGCGRPAQPQCTGLPQPS